MASKRKREAADSVVVSVGFCGCGPAAKGDGNATRHRCHRRNRALSSPPVPAAARPFADYRSAERSVVAAASASSSSAAARNLRRLLAVPGVLPSLLLGPLSASPHFGDDYSGEDDDARRPTGFARATGDASCADGIARAEIFSSSFRSLSLPLPIPLPPPPPPLERMPALALSQLLSALYDEARAGRNVRAVLGFVERALTSRYSIGEDGAAADDIEFGFATASAFAGTTTKTTTTTTTTFKGEGRDEGATSGRDGSSGEGWVACLAFMIAHDTLLRRVGRLREAAAGGDTAAHKDGTDDDDCGGSSSSSKNSILADGTVRAALSIVRIVRGRGGASSATAAAAVDDDDTGTTVGADKGPYEERNGREQQQQEQGGGEEDRSSKSSSSVERCFGAQLARLDSIVAKLGRRSEGGGGPEVGGNDDSSRQQQQGGEEVAETPGVATANGGKDWWAGVDLGSDGDDGDEGEGDEEEEPLAKMTMTGRADGTDIDGRADVVSAPATATADAPAEPPEDGPSSDQPSELERAAVELRSDLLDVPPGATSSDVQSYADRIAALVKRAGTEKGAAGVAKVGSILACGGTGRGGDLTAPEEVGRAVALPFTDVLISALTKLCVDGGTSALRATAYIRSFVLPLVLEMGESSSGNGKAAAASRVLTSTVTGLARDRPAECVDALLLPALCGPGPMRPGGTGGGGDANNDSAATAGGTYQPSQAQCELVGRVIKSIQLPKDAVASFATGIVLGRTDADAAASSGNDGMAWTENSMPIVTASLNKRPSLSDEVIVALSSNIERHSSDMSKSMKFSTLFQTFVTKYKAQIQKTGCADILRRAAGRLKTFMGRTITSALKKL